MDTDSLIKFYIGFLIIFIVIIWGVVLVQSTHAEILYSQSQLDDSSSIYASGTVITFPLINATGTYGVNNYFKIKILTNTVVPAEQYRLNGVSTDVYNLQGQLVQTNAGAEFLPAGTYILNPNGSTTAVNYSVSYNPYIHAQTLASDNFGNPFYEISTNINDLLESSYTTPDIEMVYPLNGDSRRNFTSWSVNLNYGHAGLIEIFYGNVNSSTLLFNDSKDIPFTPQDNTELFQIPHNRTFEHLAAISGSSSTTWFARPQFSWYNTSGTLQTIYGTEISFNYDPNAAYTTSTQSVSNGEVGVVKDILKNLSPECQTTSTYSFWSPSDWKCIFMNTIGTYVSSTQDFGGAIGQIIYYSAINTFPLNGFASLNNDISIAENDTSTIRNMESQSTSTFGGMKLTLLTATTTNWIQEKTGWDYKATLDTIMYVITGILILLGTVGMVLLLRKKQ